MSFGFAGTAKFGVVQFGYTSGTGSAALAPTIVVTICPASRLLIANPAAINLRFVLMFSSFHLGKRRSPAHTLTENRKNPPVC
jgi:hypothetical protein